VGDTGVAPVCLFAGGATAPNVGRLLSNLYRMLADTYQVHIVSSYPDRLDLAVPEDAIQSDATRGPAAGWTALARYARRADPAVLVQVTDPPVHGTVVTTVARALGIPSVYRYSGDRFYEYRVTRGRERLASLALGTTLGRVPVALADQCIVLGPAGRRRLLARGVSPSSITVLPPTIDTEPFETAAPASLDVPDDRNVALFVGRLTRLKGSRTLELAIPRVLSRREDIQFVCVGPTGDGLEVPARVRDRVTLVGAVPPEAIPGYMRAADVVVHPSLTEGVPRVLLEALAAGTPVLARDVGDVASVTDNTFRTDREFVELLAAFEGLAVDDVAPFTLGTQAPRYREFFGRFDGH